MYELWFEMVKGRCSNTWAKKGYEITCLHTLAIIQAQDIEITSPQWHKDVTSNKRGSVMGIKCTLWTRMKNEIL